ncbi:hypothetical protein NW249_35435 [Streptomyces sp. OUCMDZ-4982]|uniref:hypothetical protein n=1 Tax=Streptomyces sp. OUCMDZ-4982 TaxID=2973090 RepID=UPI00215D574F|nr:hypothetical protein [Streptomyces sp. OUCMDZ-4982]MCR8947380.1 hypothetical protein [Streptomyces sp. OUCMDZ-4982]
MRHRPRPCGDVGLPHGLAYARRYVTGWRCDRHTPSALRGLPEPPPGPGWPPGSYLNHPDNQPDPSEEQEPPS